ncbi:MAG: hypothetical protein LUI09_00135 [Prevotellaceae bacterium]|nr:hypothetical protein [Prevotellaceae bacterium]
MKKTIKRLSLLATVLCLAAGAFAQEEATAPQEEATTDEHLAFFGIPIQGNITDFTSSLQPRYRLQKKKGDENYYIYKGPVCGHDMYLKADYSRKSRTVYKVTVTPQYIDANAFLDSLTVMLGEPEEMEKGYRWTYPAGEILLYVAQGFDPVLIYLDLQGALAFKKEQ